jgi:hypothetical protein
VFRPSPVRAINAAGYLTLINALRRITDDDKARKIARENGLRVIEAGHHEGDLDMFLRSRAMVA